jgi:hypothetical protein
MKESISLISTLFFLKIFIWKIFAFFQLISLLYFRSNEITQQEATTISNITQSNRIKMRFKAGKTREKNREREFK